MTSMNDAKKLISALISKNNIFFVMRAGVLITGKIGMMSSQGICVLPLMMLKS